MQFFQLNVYLLKWSIPLSILRLYIKVLSSGYCCGICRTSPQKLFDASNCILSLASCVNLGDALVC